MSIKVESTTDSKETVAAVMAGTEGKVEETKAAPAPEAGETVEASAASSAEGAGEGEEPKAAAEGDDFEESEEGSSDEQKPKKKGGFKKRIDKLNAKLSTAEQEKEFWRQEALKKTQGQPVKEAVSQKVAEGKPKADDFATHEEFVEALTDWKVEQKDKERDLKSRQSALKAESEKQINSHVERVKAFATSHDDFEEVMESVDDISVSPTVQELILGSEQGPELMYELAKNRAEFERITQLAPLAAAREVGKIEARLKKQEAAIETKTTKAPRPINPVGGKASSGSKKSIYDENLTQKEYEKLRAEQLAQRA